MPAPEYDAHLDGEVLFPMRRFVPTTRAEEANDRRGLQAALHCPMGEARHPTERDRHDYRFGDGEHRGWCISELRGMKWLLVGTCLLTRGDTIFLDYRFLGEDLDVLHHDPQPLRYRDLRTELYIPEEIIAA